MPKSLLHQSTNLDMLRAFAVSLVVFDHSSKFFGVTTFFGRDMNEVGRFGVMLFFVHTCTVLMLSLERLFNESSGARAVLAFYVRRIFRIYPLSILAIIIVVGLQIPSSFIQAPYTIAILHPAHTELLGNLLLVQNVWPPRAHDVIGVLWSLPYEVQMYLLLPFLFLLVSRWERAWPLFALWVISWVPAHLFHPLQFAPHFLAGVIAYMLCKRPARSLLPSTLFPVLLILLFTGSMIFNGSHFIGGVACLILGVLIPKIATIKWRMINSLTFTIAKYSYGVYLSHLFSLWLAFDKIPRLHAVCYAALLVAIPYGLFHLVEKPLIKIGLGLAKNITHAKRETGKTDDLARTAP